MIGKGKLVKLIELAVVARYEPQIPYDALVLNLSLRNKLVGYQVLCVRIMHRHLDERLICCVKVDTSEDL
jgi:hypothetical protein